MLNTNVFGRIQRELVTIPAGGSIQRATTGTGIRFLAARSLFTDEDDNVFPIEARPDLIRVTAEVSGGDRSNQFLLPTNGSYDFRAREKREFFDMVRLFNDHNIPQAVLFETFDAAWTPSPIAQSLVGYVHGVVTSGSTQLPGPLQYFSLGTLAAKLRHGTLARGAIYLRCGTAVVDAYLLASRSETMVKIDGEANKGKSEFVTFPIDNIGDLDNQFMVVVIGAMDALTRIEVELAVYGE